MPANKELVRSLRPGKTKFDLSYSKVMTADMGYLYPAGVQEMGPGDVASIAVTLTARMMPLVSPVLHGIQIKTATIFCPTRILDEDNWEGFITGETERTDPGGNDYVLPRWNPASTAVGSLWDYSEMPTGVTPPASTKARPIDYLRRAYVRCWNEYFRDQNVVDPKDEDTTDEILKIAWRKDRFSSALPWPQKGSTPALPISGTINLEFPTSIIQQTADPHATANAFGHDGSTFVVPTTRTVQDVIDSLEEGTVDLENGSTFDINDIRRVAQIQQFMERNARTGTRLIEFLRSHYGTAPKDDRLQRPEYVSGSRTPVVISEVLGTNQDGTDPLGNMAGHGITVDGSSMGSYRALEHGFLFTFMWIMPDNLYQQGINKLWQKETRYDYLFPEFVGLGEQVIDQSEIYASGVQSENETPFGFQAQYDEYRERQNVVCGLMRTDFDHWHISRQFTTAPTLNEDFIYGTPRKDIFAVPSEPGFVISFGNICQMVRPLPFIAEPGISRL